MHQEGVDQHDIAGAEATLRPAPDTEAHRTRHHQIGDEGLADIEPGQRVFGFDGGIGIASCDLGIIAGLAVLGIEIFDRLIVEQAVYRACDSGCIELVHLLAQLVAPVGDALGEEDIGHDHDDGREHQPDAEFEPEYHQHREQLDRGRCDVEQHEIEHHVDAFGAALDHLGNRAGAAVHVEAHRQPVQVRESVFRQAPRRILPDALENRIPQIVKQHSAKARAGVSNDQPDREPGTRFKPRLHPVDRRTVNEAHRKLHAL